jgi:hypothetical protein
MIVYKRMHLTPALEQFFLRGFLVSLAKIHVVVSPLVLQIGSVSILLLSVVNKMLRLLLYSSLLPPVIL